MYDLPTFHYNRAMKLMLIRYELKVILHGELDFGTLHHESLKNSKDKFRMVNEVFHMKDRRFIYTGYN